MPKSLLMLPSLLALMACGGDAPDAAGPAGKTPTVAQDAAQPEAEGPRATVDWALATAHPLATDAGAAILAEGGTAVDAAVAVQAVLGLVEPESSGLAGGAFLLLFDVESKKILTYDGREAAPLSVGPDLFLGDDGEPLPFREILADGKAVGVPGAVAMLDLAHRQHGRLPWADLFTEAGRLANDGFAVTPKLAQRIEQSAETLSQDPGARAVLFDAEGAPLKAGATLTNPEYAQTVAAIADGGAAAFYTGDIAQEIVDTVNARAGDGHMTLDDFAVYEPVERAPVCAPFTVYKVCTMGPPSSAATALQMLRMMEAKGLPETAGPEFYTLFAEAARLGFADRAVYLGDPSAMARGNYSADEIVEGLLSADYVGSRAALIGDVAAETVEAGNPMAWLSDGLAPDTSPEAPGTSHFSIRDSYGNILSMTTTIEGAFGSDIMAAGMFLNNELTDFSFVPERDGVQVVNAVEPGKRPRSSMTPVIVLDEEGDVVMAMGSPGGPTIISTVAKTVVLSLGLDMPVQESIDLSHVIARGSRVFVEETITPEARAALEQYGYDVRVRQLTSGLHGFRIHEDGELEPGVDPRREGTFRQGE